MREMELGTPHLPQICGELTFHDGINSEWVLRGVVDWPDVKDTSSASSEAWEIGALLYW